MLVMLSVSLIINARGHLAIAVVVVLSWSWPGSGHCGDCGCACHGSSHAHHGSCTCGHAQGQLDACGCLAAMFVVVLCHGYQVIKVAMVVLREQYMSIGHGCGCGHSQWSEVGLRCVGLVVVRYQEAINGGVRNSSVKNKLKS